MKPQSEKDKQQVSTNTETVKETGTERETENEKILCSHCKRTATNGIKCKGICVADNDY